MEVLSIIWSIICLKIGSGCVVTYSDQSKVVIPFSKGPRSYNFGSSAVLIAFIVTVTSLAAIAPILIWLPWVQAYRGAIFFTVCWSLFYLVGFVIVFTDTKVIDRIKRDYGLAIALNSDLRKVAVASAALVWITPILMVVFVPQ